MNNFLEIKNLSIAFPGNHLVNTLNNFNLKLKKNGSLGIVGESGSGKKYACSYEITSKASYSIFWLN